MLRSVFVCACYRCVRNEQIVVLLLLVMLSGVSLHARAWTVRLFHTSTRTFSHFKPIHWRARCIFEFTVELNSNIQWLGMGLQVCYACLDIWQQQQQQFRMSENTPCSHYFNSMQHPQFHTYNIRNVCRWILLFVHTSAIHTNAAEDKPHMETVKEKLSFIFVTVVAFVVFLTTLQTFAFICFCRSASVYSRLFSAVLCTLPCRSIRYKVRQTVCVCVCL